MNDMIGNALEKKRETEIECEWKLDGRESEVWMYQNYNKICNVQGKVSKFFTFVS